MNLFEQILERRGYPFREAKAQLAALHELSPQAFQQWQEEARWGVVRHHLETNSFYRTHQERLPSSWEELKPMAKEHLQQPLEQLLSEPFGLDSVHRDNTSGSSGHPFWYAKDRFCHALSWALVSHRYGLHGLQNNSLQARFYGIPKSGSGRWRERLKDRLMRRRRFPVFDLSDSALEQFAQHFKRQRFDYLYGYTQSLVLFAQYLQGRGLVLNDLCPTLKRCMVTSEVCRKVDRDLLEVTFGVPVVNEYGASEVSIIAFEWPDGSWRLSEETLFVEADEEGELLITSLFNRAFPLIRYRIGDLGRLSETPLGGRWRELMALEGRTNDVIRLPSGKKAAGLTFYYVLRAVLERNDSVRESIVRQTALDTFRLEVVSSSPLRDEEVEILRQETERYLEPGLKLEVVSVPRIERPASGKLQQFYSDLT